ncbi:MAG: TOBE domain-containing protein, partial [Deinococcus sp.]
SPLRAELRAEMHEVFTRSGAVVVYSTTEPLGALALGGHVAVLAEGRLIQAGSTLEVYHHPASQRVGEVFSDPPMNLLEASLGGGEASFLGGRFPLPPHLRALPDGPYQIGVRANHVTLSPLTSGDITFQARIELAELSGSETYLHTRAGPSRVVGQLEGIHSLELGQDLTLHLDPRRLFAFGEGGMLAAAPPRVRAGVA